MCVKSQRFIGNFKYTSTYEVKVFASTHERTKRGRNVFVEVQSWQICIYGQYGDDSSASRHWVMSRKRRHACFEGFCGGCCGIKIDSGVCTLSWNYPEKHFKRALSITFRKPPKCVFCAVFSSQHRQS